MVSTRVASQQKGLKTRARRTRRECGLYTQKRTEVFCRTSDKVSATFNDQADASLPALASKGLEADLRD